MTEWNTNPIWISGLLGPVQIAAKTSRARFPCCLLAILATAAAAGAQDRTPAQTSLRRVSRQRSTRS